MRQIKYRYWYGGKMEQVGQLEFFVDAHITVNDELIGGQLMQFTGLLDKNGKEIYEGDICKYPFSDDFVIGEVIYFGAMFGLGGIGLNQIPKFSIEVLGNIYQNSELLN